MIVSELFPEVQRYWSTEMRPQRLVAGLVTSLVIGGCLASASYATSDAGPLIFVWALAAEAVVLLGYATTRVVGSVMNERLDKTWDLQRLTPLSSAEIAGGKFLGAPLFAYFLALLFVPWALLGRMLMTQAPPIGLVWAHVLLACGAFLIISLGLLVSAYAERMIGGGSPTTAAALMAFFALQAGVWLYELLKGGGPVTYYGFEIPLRPFLALSALAFGAWALAGACWRIGKDLLERRRCWRLPAFIVFLTFFQLGFPARSGSFAILLPVILCYLAATMNPAGLEDVKLWVEASGPRSLDLTPLWIQGLITCLVLAAALTLSPGPSSGLGVPEARLPLLLVFFATRDLAFLQWCRFTQTRRPEVLAGVYITLLYVLPAIMSSAFKAHLTYWYFPAPYAGVGALANALPALVQAVLMLGALAWRYRSLTEASALLE